MKNQKRKKKYIPRDRDGYQKHPNTHILLYQSVQF